MAGLVTRVRRHGAVLAVCLAACWLTPASGRSPAAGPIVLVEQTTAAPDAPRVSTLPARLSDDAFWALSEQLSEPAGYFRSENLVSNEHTFQYVIPDLVRQVRAGGVYLGVAPDQNFTYIAAIRPRMAFILDIRRGNLLEHLMYKAIFELSADRAEFVSRLFSKPRPAGARRESTATELFAAFEKVATSRELYARNVAAIRGVLLERHRFPLSAEDMEQIESIYFAFFWDGPGIRYSMSFGPGGRGFQSGFPTFEDLALQTDWNGEARSYLASETNYRFVRGLEQKNLIVPVVGNFAGPKALRAIGQYLRDRHATVTAFYVSNVEQYLFQDRAFDDFARNVSMLPTDPWSTFIRSVSISYGYGGTMIGPDGRASALDSIQGFVRDFRAGGLVSYIDVNARSR